MGNLVEMWALMYKNLVEIAWEIYTYHNIKLD